MTPKDDPFSKIPASRAEENESPEERLFLQALCVTPGADRDVFLRGACDGNEALRKRVESLLQACGHLGRFMEGSGSDDGTLTQCITPGDALAAQLCESVRSSANASSVDRLEDLVGQYVGRYRLLEKLGEGGSAVVYGAEQEEPVQRQVALKVIKLGMDTKSVIARFDAERQALARMEHPHIAKVFDAGATATGRPFFVMEWVRGTRITDFCREQKQSLSQRLRLFIDVCHAVQHAHQKGILHRDLKPSNVLVIPSEGGGPAVPKIIDFGIAKATQGKLTDLTLYTAFEQFLGTPAYMSPEQTRLSNQDIDTRTDVYSLGVLLYELLSGSTPFATSELMKASLNEMGRIICEQTPVRPSVRLEAMVKQQEAESKDVQCVEFRHQVRGDLDWIVMKCLEKERPRRYATISALAEDLERYLNHKPVMARPTSRWYELQKMVRRHRVAFGSTVFAFLALVMGLVVSLWQAERVREAERRQRATAEDRRYHAYVSDMNLAQQALQVGDLGRARQLLQGSIPKAGESDLRNWEWRYLAQACRGGERLSLVGHQRVVNNIRFVDTNTIVTTGLRDFRTFLWDLSQGRAVKIWTNANHGGGVGLIALASTQRRLYTRAGWQASDSVRRFDLDRGTDQRFHSFEEPVVALEVSTDEKTVAIAHGNKVSFLSTATDSAEHQEWVHHGAPIRAMAYSPITQKWALVDLSGKLALWDPVDQNEEWVADLFNDVDPDLQNERWMDEDGWCRFSPDGQTIVLSGGGHRVVVVRLSDQKILRSFPDSPASIDGCFSPDGRWLVTVGGNTTIRVWDTASWKLKYKWNGHTDVVHCLDISPDGRWLATGSRNGEVKIWSMTGELEPVDVLELPASLGAGVSQDGSAFWRLIGSESRNPLARSSHAFSKVECGSAETMNLDSSIDVSDLSLNESSVIAQASRAKGVAILAPDGRIHFRKPGVVGDVSVTPRLENLSRVQISADASYVVAVSFLVGRTDDWPITVWRLPEMKLIAERNDLRNVHQIQLSEDGRWLALMTGPGEIGVLAMPTLEGPPFWKADGKVASWTAFAFSLDARYLATALGSGEATIWNLQSRVALPLPRSLGEYRSLSFTADGTRLAAGDAQSIRIFDTRTGEIVLSLPIGQSQLAFTRPESDALGSIQSDHVIRLTAPRISQYSWERVDSGIPLERAPKPH